MIEYLLPRRIVVLSFRGRGQSETPGTGYTLDDHVSDIKHVVDELNLTQFHLFGYSRGVSYTLGYATRFPEQIISLILQDYPPMHKEMPRGWADDYINNYLEPNNRSNHIRPEAIRGIEKDSRTFEFEIVFKCPILIMRGLLKESLLSKEELERYKKHNDITIKEFINSGHDIRNTEEALFNRTIRNFLDYLEK